MTKHPPSHPSPNNKPSRLLAEGRTLLRRSATLLILIPSYGQASIDINAPRLERDLMVLLAAVSTFVLLLLLHPRKGALRARPIGRRASDLAKLIDPTSLRNWLSARRKVMAISWEPVEIDSYTCNLKTPVRWRISLYATARLAVPSRRFDEYNEDLFHFAEDHAEAEMVVAPILRKIYARYREQFEIRTPIQVFCTEVNEESVTWLRNETDIRSLVFTFLDECLMMSRIWDASPSLAVCRGSNFSLTVMWPRSNDIDWINRVYYAHPELELIENEETIGLRLHLAFPRNAIPSRTRPLAERRSVG